MQTAAKICRVFMWLTLVIGGGMQWLGIYGISVNNRLSDDPYTLWPLIVAMLLLTGAAIYVSIPATKPHRLWGVLAAGLAAIIIFVMVLDLWLTFDVSMVISGGITFSTLLIRHASSILVFVFLLAAHLCERAIPEEQPEGEPPFSSLLADIDMKD